MAEALGHQAHLAGLPVRAGDARTDATGPSGLRRAIGGQVPREGRDAEVGQAHGVDHGSLTDPPDPRLRVALPRVERHGPRLDEPETEPVPSRQGLGVLVGTPRQADPVRDRLAEQGHAALTLYLRPAPQAQAQRAQGRLMGGLRREAAEDGLG